MILFFVSFLAGILTVLAPCVLPLLPVIIGSSLSDIRSRLKPYTIAISLSLSIILFTLILKFSTALINIPQSFWSYFSGTIVLVFGLSYLFPEVSERALLKFNLFISRRSNKLLAEGDKKNSFVGDIIIGASLGPVFSSCSPTYFLILATVLPQSFFKGLIYLIAYSVGLSLMLLLIAKIGQKFASRLEGISNPHGKFKKTLGILFLIVGVGIMFGYDKKLQTYIISNEIFDVAKIEQKLLQKTEKTGDMEKAERMRKGTEFSKYKELQKVSGFINSEPFKLEDVIGKQVVLLEIMTYSCINCQRTFPYVNSWYEKYKDKGLLIVGIHTPEFSFEKNKENVEKAMTQFGIKFPVVLDNDYGTWNAYGNRYWPRKYLIDIDGFVRYDHIGEGDYDVIEEEIKELLKERAKKFGKEYNLEVNSVVNAPVSLAESPETYFGAFRNYNFGNGVSGTTGEKEYSFPKNIKENFFYFDGIWKIQNEYSESVKKSKLRFDFKASKVFMVAEGDVDSFVKVFIDDKLYKTVNIENPTLYNLFESDVSGDHSLRLEFSPKVKLYTFTFG